MYIANFIKRNSRVPNSKYKSITFNQLNTRLNNFGYRLMNPQNNHIDVVRIEERRKLFGFGKKETVNVKVAQIGFPGWKCQVGQGAIATVRREAKLRSEDGFDSKTFYEGLDPIPPLIDRYKGILERLAHK